MNRLRILTWHVHGSYLSSLSHAPHDFYLPVKPGRPAGYAGRTEGFPWPENVREIPAHHVRRLELDCILFQSRQNYLLDQEEILSPAQRRLPRIYLEHEPPRDHPTDARHLVDDPDVLVVHVTPFNQLMWNCGRAPTRVIDHGIAVPEGVRYTGELPRGITMIDHLRERGRRFGADLFETAREEVPLDLIGEDAESMGGLGQVPPQELGAFLARHRFFFNPVRYASLGFPVCKAMMIGLPILGLATTEMATTVRNGISGYVETDLNRLIERMKELIADPAQAHRLGEGARRDAWERFGIARFAQDWDAAFRFVTDRAKKAASASILMLPQTNAASSFWAENDHEDSFIANSMARPQPARIATQHARWCR